MLKAVQHSQVQCARTGRSEVAVCVRGPWHSRSVHYSATRTPTLPIHSIRGTNKHSTPGSERLFACRSVDVSTAAGQLAARGPDLTFQSPNGVTISVFGVEHLEREAHIGEYILLNIPSAVVVETAATPTHGSAPGNTLTCQDQVEGAAGFFLKVFCQVAAALDQQGPGSWRLPNSPWQQAASSFNGEQLAYIAAFARGSTLVFGDRPKDVTYRRLASLASLAELDAAFGAEVVVTYASLVGGAAAAEAEAALRQTKVWEIMMKEREVIMCGVLHQLCHGGLPQVQQLQEEGPPKEVVLVLGAAHIPGLQQLWSSGEWQHLLGADKVADSPLLRAPTEPLGGRGSGVKRGLLEAVFQLSVTQEVLDDMLEVLPAIQDEKEEEARQWAFEIYSSYRMQLAVLPEGLLQQVCGAVQGCSMEEVLRPLRALRPVNGGSGWDEAVGMELRALNFDLDAEE